MKRICLYAGYSPINQIDDYVIRQVIALAQEADVFCCFDYMPKDGELDKIRPYCKLILCGRHNGYDFGSWQKLINHLGWKKIEKYEQMIICNDSCYGPFFPFAESFTAAQRRQADFWGMTASYEQCYHIQSYFMAFNQKIIRNPVFRQFWQEIKPQKNVAEVIKNYELKLTSLLQKQNFSAFALATDTKGDNPTFYPFRLLRGHHLPLIKVKCFTKADIHLSEVCRNWQNLLQNISDYPLPLIKNHCQTLGIDCDKSLTAAMDKLEVAGKFTLLGIFSMQINRKLCLKVKLFGFTICKKFLSLQEARKKKQLIEELNHKLKR